MKWFLILYLGCIHFGGKGFANEKVIAIQAAQIQDLKNQIDKLKAENSILQKERVQLLSDFTVLWRKVSSLAAVYQKEKNPNAPELDPLGGCSVCLM